MKSHYVSPSPVSLPDYSTKLLSVITPAYNEADNLPLLYERLTKVLSLIDINWEWIIVDDHSTDGTFSVIEEISQHNNQVHGIRFARNFGSHTAITCGFHRAKGDCAVVMAADLQDPPETLSALLAEWQEGVQVVWAVRRRREGEKVSKIGFARLYYWLMRHLVGMKDLPSTGADFFLIDRQVIKALREFRESHVSILALITWMGFHQSYITYDKQARVHGSSGWNLNKKFKLVWDSITSFSYFPIRFMSYLGLVVAFLGFLYAGFVVILALIGQPPQGWSSLMVVVLVIGGMQMLMMGILGEYLWRALDESRHRPRYLVERTTQSTDQSRS